MSAPYIVALPPDVDLDGGCTIRVTAIDPTTGDTVAGVQISNVSIQVIDVAGAGAGAFAIGPFMLVPGPAA